MQFAHDSSDDSKYPIIHTYEHTNVKHRQWIIKAQPAPSTPAASTPTEVDCERLINIQACFAGVNSEDPIIHNAYLATLVRATRCIDERLLAERPAPFNPTSTYSA
jgi:hypothetical protein